MTALRRPQPAPEPTPPTWLAPDSDLAADPTSGVYGRDHVFGDELGEVDAQLIRSGIRWVVLRWIHRKRRLELWREIQAAEMPAGTRTCWEGAEVWLDEVRTRVEAQPWQQRRKNTWLSVATLLAQSTRTAMRPLTEISHEAIAAAVEVDKCYVTRVIRWYRDQGLLGKLLGGTRYVPVEVPEDETDTERSARLAAAAEADAARAEFRRAARAHAEAELAAASANRRVPAADLEQFRDLRERYRDSQSPPMANLTSVYELRIPAPPPLPGSGNDTGPRHDATVIDLATRRRRPATPHRGAPAGNAPTSSDLEKFNPNQHLKEDLVSPEDRSNVEERRAPRGFIQENASRSEGPGQAVTRRSVAWRTAEALLVGPVDGWCDEDVTLPWPLRRGVSRSWLAALVRPLIVAGWTPLEISWHIATGGGAYRMLPVRILSPRAFIRSSVRAANPAVRPAVSWAADDLLRDTDEHIARMATQLAAADARAALDNNEAARARAAARQADIDACELCDELGWLQITGPHPVEALCSHNPETAGW